MAGVVGGAIPVNIPDAIVWNPFLILRDGIGYVTSVDYLSDWESSFKPTTAQTLYVDFVNGDNSNDGSTELLAFKGISSALIAATGTATIMVKGGAGQVYGLDFRINSASANYVVQGYGDANPIIGAGFNDLTWSKTGGQTNVYESTDSRADNTVQVFDFTSLGSHGEAATYTNVADVATCDSTAGSWVIVGTTLYVHTLDSDEPVYPSVIASQDSQHSIFKTGFDTSSAIAYLADLDIYGTVLARGGGVSAPKIYIRDCNQYYARSSQNQMWFEGVESVFFNVKAYKGGSQDGFNYHEYDNGVQDPVAPLAAEINCQVIDLDQGTTTSDQCSSIHDGGTVIRVGGIYGPSNNNSSNQIIHDINSGTKSLNVGLRINCTAGIGAGLQIGVGAEMWVAGIRFDGGEPLNRLEYNGTMYYENQNLTNVGGTGELISGWYDFAEFDGAAYVAFADDFAWANAWSVTLDIYETGSGVQSIFYPDAFSGWVIMLNGSKIRVKINGSNFESTETLSDSTWSTVVISYTGGNTGTISIKIDDNTAETFVNDASDAANTNGVNLGANQQESPSFVGRMRNLIVTNGGSDYVNAPLLGSLNDRAGSNDGTGTNIEYGKS